jgi:Holliday junction resolvase RusA-like endonuclease
MTYVFKMDIIKVSNNKFFSRGHWSKRNDLKNDFITLLKATKIKHKVTNPCSIEFDFYFKGRLIDCDNVSAMGKCITDALVKTGVLFDDSPKWVYEVIYRSHKSKENYCKITIKEKDESNTQIQPKD